MASCPRGVVGGHAPPPPAGGTRAGVGVRVGVRVGVPQGGHLLQRLDHLEPDGGVAMADVRQHRVEQLGREWLDPLAAVGLLRDRLEHLHGGQPEQLARRLDHGRVGVAAAAERDRPKLGEVGLE